MALSRTSQVFSESIHTCVQFVAFGARKRISRAPLTQMSNPELEPRSITVETALPLETVGAVARSLLADASWDELRRKHQVDSVPLLTLVAQLDRELGAAAHRNRAHRVSFRCTPSGTDQVDVLTIDFPARRPAAAARNEHLAQPCLSTPSEPAAEAAAGSAATSPVRAHRLSAPNALLEEALSLLGLPATAPSAPRKALDASERRSPRASSSSAAAAAQVACPQAQASKRARATTTAHPRSSPEPRERATLERSPIAARTPYAPTSSRCVPGHASYKSPATGRGLAGRGHPRGGAAVLTSPTAPSTPALLSTRSRKRSLTDA